MKIAYFLEIYFLLFFLVVCARPLSLTNVFLSPLSTSLLRLIRAISLVCLERGLGLRFPVYHPEPTIDRRAPALTLYARVFFSLSPHTCTLCPMFSFDPSVVGLVPLCPEWPAGGRLASASFPSSDTSSLLVDFWNSKIYTICKASLIEILSGRLPQKRFTKKDCGSRLYRAFRLFLNGIVFLAAYS